MKLLHLTSSYPPFATGVAEKQCALLVRELAVRNHVNRVLTSDVTLPNIPDHDPQVNRRLRLFSPAGPRDFARLFLTQRYNRRVLIEELDQLLPDLVVVWNMAGLSHSLLWEIQRRRLRMVFAVLDGWPRHRLRDDPWYWWWAAPLPLDQKIFRRLLREIRLAPAILRSHPAYRPHSLRMRRGFFASRALRDSVRLAGFDVDGTEVLPHCLGRDELHAAPQRREELRRLLWIGSLNADHDPVTAIQALQELRHQGEMRFSLDLFGRGEVTMEARVRDYVRSAQLAGAVTVRQVSVEEVAMLYPSYDIFLHTARQPDAFPLVLVRAMAARVPIVATPEGSANEVVRNGHNALTFRTADPADCAEKILRLATDRALIDEITERGYREVLDVYSSAVVGGRLDHLLHAAMQTPVDSGD